MPRAGLLSRRLAPCVLLLLSPPLAAKVGYGYKKSEDPLVLGIKRIIYAARNGDWGGCEAEFRRLDWQFQEFRDDLAIDIEDDFASSIRARTLEELSRGVCKVMYLAVKQKFHWNRVEGCKKYVPAKSRVEAALFYYEEILSIGVRDYDGKNGKEVHRRLHAEFRTLRGAIGTAGLFGLGAREPDLEAFSKSSEAVLAGLREVYPYLGDAEAARLPVRPEDRKREG
jgi:hypothetical protein